MAPSTPTDPRTSPGKTQRPEAVKKLKIGLVGFGTVGRSVAKLLSRDAAGPFQLTYVCNRNVER